MRDNLLGDPNRGDDVTPELAQLASERALKQGSQGMLQGGGGSTASREKRLLP